MCFSASASFIAGGALSSVGVVTLKKTKKKSAIPFASLPLLFGIQQIIEGIIWLTISTHHSVITSLMTFFYSLFAYAFWPIFVPLSVRIMEPVVWRKKILSILASLGIALGIYLLYYVVRYPVSAALGDHTIMYSGYVPFGYEIFWTYLAITTISCFFSSHPFVRLFGGLLLLFVPISHYVHDTSFVSTWCFFSALLSIVVYLHVRSQNRSLASSKAQIRD